MIFGRPLRPHDGTQFLRAFGKSPSPSPPKSRTPLPPPTPPLVSKASARPPTTRAHSIPPKDSKRVQMLDPSISSASIRSSSTARPMEAPTAKPKSFVERHVERVKEARRSRNRSSDRNYEADTERGRPARRTDRASNRHERWHPRRYVRVASGTEG